MNAIVLDKLAPYLKHLPHCPVTSPDPMYYECICGLREAYHELDTEIKHLETKIAEGK